MLGVLHLAQSVLLFVIAICHPFVHWSHFLLHSFNHTLFLHACVCVCVYRGFSLWQLWSDSGWREAVDLGRWVSLVYFFLPCLQSPIHPSLTVLAGAMGRQAAAASRIYLHSSAKGGLGEGGTRAYRRALHVHQQHLHPAAPANASFFSFNLSPRNLWSCKDFIGHSRNTPPPQPSVTLWPGNWFHRLLKTAELCSILSSPLGEIT